MVPEKLLKVIEDNLCTRCGACVGICPNQCLFLDHNNFPQVQYSCSNECNLCLTVCPGFEVNFPKLTYQLFKKRFDVTNPMGIFQKILVGHSMNKEIREKATSGGIITQILVNLLEMKEIDGAIITTSDPKESWKAKPIIATDKMQIIKSAQSKYCISPVNYELKKILEVNGKFAFVGLPCHVHAIRKLIEKNKNLAKKISPILGLYCSTTLEKEAIPDLIDVSNISSNDIQNVEFRSGKWPGFMGVKLKDGTFKKLHRGHIKNIYPILHRLYCPNRCMVCIDGSNELADMSIADPWITNKKGEYLYPKGDSLVIVRTDVGQKFLDLAQKDGSLFLEDITRESFLDMNLLMMKNKRKMAFFTIEKLKRKGMSVPNYYSSLPMNYKGFFNGIIMSLPFFLGKFNFTRKLALRIYLSPFESVIKKVRDILKQKRFQ